MAKKDDFKAVHKKALKLGSRWFYKKAYFVLRFAFKACTFRYLRVETTGAEKMDIKGRFILAPVHRSNLDPPLVNSVCKRRVRSLTKISMFKNKLLVYLMPLMGCVPVDRGKADKKALEICKGLLKNDEVILVFPEGTRQSGEKVKEVFEGCSYLSMKTSSPVIPVGIAGTEEAMSVGTKMPRRSFVSIVVGDPIYPPPKGKSKSERQELTLKIKKSMQASLDQALQISSKRRNGGRNKRRKRVGSSKKGGSTKK